MEEATHTVLMMTELSPLEILSVSFNFCFNKDKKIFTCVWTRKEHNHVDDMPQESLQDYVDKTCFFLHIWKSSEAKVTWRRAGQGGRKALGELRSSWPATPVIC